MLTAVGRNHFMPESRPVVVPASTARRSSISVPAPHEKIPALREKAKQALGPKFSLKEFHNVVLRTGGVPLTVLEQVIDYYLAAAQR